MFHLYDASISQRWPARVVRRPALGEVSPAYFVVVNIDAASPPLNANNVSMVGSRYPVAAFAWWVSHPFYESRIFLPLSTSNKGISLEHYNHH